MVKDKVTQLKLSGEASAKGLEDLEVNYAPWSNECVDIYPYKGYPCSLEFTMTKIKESLMWGRPYPMYGVLTMANMGSVKIMGTPTKFRVSQPLVYII